MFKPSLKERIDHKLELYTNFIFAPFRKKRLNNRDFTIISNNCWGGHVYEYFGLPKLSPTVGCYFFADDYLKFVEYFDYYINQPLGFISLNDSKYKKEIINNGKDNLKASIGILKDIEIVFLHYKTKEIALEKWNRRIKRINQNNLIFKFSQQNLCNDEHIIKFEKLKLNGKKFVLQKNQIKLIVEFIILVLRMKAN